MAVTLLIADDEKDIRDMLASCFRRQGYQVLTAAGGQEAMKLAARQPDLILLDVSMPDMDGLEVCRRMGLDFGADSQEQLLNELLEEMGIVRAPAAVLEKIPKELVMALRRGGMGGSAALVRDVRVVRHLLPDVVVDKLSIDEMMQFYGGSERE